MTKFKNTIFGKILKVAAIGGGAVLGLGAGIKVIKGIKAGTGALSKINTGLGAIRNKANASTLLKDNARGLISGLTKNERNLIKAQADESRDLQGKLNAMQKLIDAGATPAEARAKLGLPAEELTSFQGEQIQEASLVPIQGTQANKMILYAGLALAALFIIPKLLKK